MSAEWKGSDCPVPSRACQIDRRPHRPDGLRRRQAVIRCRREEGSACPSRPDTRVGRFSAIDQRRSPDHCWCGLFGRRSYQHGCGGCPAHSQRRNAPDPEQSAEAAISRAGGAGNPAWRKMEPGDLSRQRSIRQWSIGHGSCCPFLWSPRSAAVNGSVGANKTGGLPSPRLSRP